MYKKKQLYFTCTTEDLLLTGIGVGCFIREIWIVGRPSLEVYPPRPSKAALHITQSRMSYFIQPFSIKIIHPSENNVMWSGAVFTTIWKDWNTTLSEMFPDFKFGNRPQWIWFQSGVRWMARRRLLFLVLSSQQPLMRTCLPPADFKLNTCHVLLEIREINLLQLCVK